MDNPQQLKCDTPDCIHWQEGGCVKETAVLIQEHHCTAYKGRIMLPNAAVTIEVSGGVVQNVYASPDLPEIRVELIDFDNLREESEAVETHSRQLLSMIAQNHKHIF